MSFERGALESFEVVWKNGHSEVVEAHQVSYLGGGWFDGGKPEVISFHGEFDGKWLLVLRALGSDLHSVRNLTRTEQKDTTS